MARLGVATCKLSASVCGDGEVMELNRILASRRFSEDDQKLFATLSGDFNPMHVDAIAARRIGAGAPVVHGMHSLLWCLDCIAPTIVNESPVSSLRANFDTYVTTSDEVETVLLQSDAERLRVEVQMRGIAAVTVLVGFGDELAPPFDKRNEFIEPTDPMDLPQEALPTLSGRLRFATSSGKISELFPMAARMIGARRIAGLAAYTRLIGMVCPGLHSIFNRVSLEYSYDDGADDIGFRVRNADLERRRLLIAVGGGGWSGTLTTLIRHQPMTQPSIIEASKHVTRGEFANSVALIIGGSRGIGEVAAKLIAAGGGETIITYAKGARDADLVSKEIRDFGGDCHVAKVDIRLPIAVQLSALGKAPNQLLYFATPMIGGRRNKIFDGDRLTDFMNFYVNGFYECCKALIDDGVGNLTALYPSSVFVKERPPGFVEYAMAKAAGEQLCMDMTRDLASFRAVVARLPRLATDQNPGLAATAERPEICKLLLPLIRELRASP
jgi:acyl dehydratase/NAD(P)-dependent dehydrogenase (short-subunit alcohol dehydrogenase family)